MAVDDVGDVGAYCRECHGFVNLCRLVPQVPAGVGMGCEFVTLAQPIPMKWV